MTITPEKCRQMGCGFEASYTDPAMARRVLSEHLASSHGIGRPRGAESRLGCPVLVCDFEVAGSPEFTRTMLRDHLVGTHGVDPENPEIPAEFTRGER